MKIRNYTSNVPVEKSLMAIERLLAEAGATRISKTYQNGCASGIIFQIAIGPNQVSFKLPSRASSVKDLFKAEIRRPRRGTLSKIEEQASRTAWKLLHDWVSVQVSMIKLEQAEALEIFLPYAYDSHNDQTFFERIKDGGFKMLKAAGE